MVIVMVMTMRVNFGGDGDYGRNYSEIVNCCYNGIPIVIVMLKMILIIDSYT